MKRTTYEMRIKDIKFPIAQLEELKQQKPPHTHI